MRSKLGNAVLFKPKLDLLHDSGLGFGEEVLLSPVSEACTSLLGESGEGETVDWDELGVESSSMIAPLALQTSNCSLVNPRIPCK